MLNTRPLKTMMDRAAADGIFPGGVLLVASGKEVDVIPAGRLAAHPESQPTKPDTIYDLASLTKILSTTILTMIFTDQGRIGLDQTIAELLPEPVPIDKESITVRQLLAHASGMAAWRPLYRTLEKKAPSDRVDTAIQMILAEPLVAPPGKATLYSDLNFMLLGFIMERISGYRQDALFNWLFTHPLGLMGLGYRPGDCRFGALENIAPTELGPRTGGPLDEPTAEIRDTVPLGCVHDDNASSLFGVAGHAGLFASAKGVWDAFNVVRRAWLGRNEEIINGDTVREFLRRSTAVPGTERALGFDTWTAPCSGGSKLSPGSVGHTGYTGTSLWWDQKRDLSIILLTNRVHPTAKNTAIIDFRPKLHDLAVDLWEETS